MPFCPELAGGFPVPRPPAEIEGAGGDAVLDGEGRVVEVDGEDVTAYFRAGTELALGTTGTHHAIKLAILKEGSPSCGSGSIYDGSFSGRSRPGRGVTTALLERNGVRVFNEAETAAAARYPRELEKR